MSLGFLVGVSHALEADHLAALGAIGCDERRGRLFLVGAAWGVGHGITVLILGGLIVGFGLVMTDHRTTLLEFAVGVMLTGLGVSVMWRLLKHRVHFHPHDHGDGVTHVHAHSHTDSSLPHETETHDHRHWSWRRWPFRATFVGLMHGAAGMAGLVTLTSVAEREMSLAYLAVFSIGAIAGMGILSMVVVWPIKWAERSADWLFRCAVAISGVVATGIGFRLMMNTGPQIFGM